jgi:hypothetical protein
VGPGYLQEGAQNQTGAIGALVFVRILLFLAAAAGARQLTKKGTATLIGDAPIARSRSRENVNHFGICRSIR